MALLGALAPSRSWGTESIPLYFNSPMRRNSSQANIQGSVTRRQAEILNLILDGQGSADIALSLGIARQTLQNHMKPLLQTFGVRNRAELIIAVLRLQNITPRRIVARALKRKRKQ